MGAARTVTTTTIKTDVRYELRDEDKVLYSDAELLAYINKCLEMTYEILVYEKSELIRTGTGTVTTVAGTQSYALADNTMGDLWVPHRIWVDTYEPMDWCEEEDLYDTINEEEAGNTSHRSQPDEYCIVGDYLWFKEAPDDAYTVRLKYFPNFIPLTTGGTMPYKNLFNQEIIEGVKLLAKYRNELDVQIESILKDLFQNRALKIMRMRRTKTIKITPKWK